MEKSMSGTVKNKGKESVKNFSIAVWGCTSGLSDRTQLVSHTVASVCHLAGRGLRVAGKENGVNILKSIDEGPFQMGTIRDTLAKGTEGLPKDIYTLINHYTEAKDIWDNVKMLLEGSELTKEDRESQLYDDFEHFCQNKGEIIHDYYVRFAKIINDMRNIKMTMSRMQLNSKFVNNMLPEWGRFITAVNLNRGLRDSSYDQLYSYLKQHEAHANETKMMLDRFTQHTVDPLALMSNVLHQQVDRIEVKGTMQGVQVHLVMRELTTELGMQIQVKQGRLSATTATENGVVLDEEQLLFIAGGQDNVVDEDVDEQPVQDLPLNVDNVFQANDCDAFDSDVDEAPTAQTMFMENLSSADPVFDEANPSYNSDILSEVPDHDNYQDAVCEHHEVHEMHDKVQPNYVVDSHADYTSDSNMISYDQYVKDNAVPVIQSNVSSVPNDAYMMILNDNEPFVQCVSVTTQNNVVDKSLIAELATYKEQVELYERRAKFELTEKEQKINEQLRIVIANRNLAKENLKRELHSVKLQLTTTINHNKSMVEEVTSLKKDFKQKENKHLEEFLDMKVLKEKVEDILFKQDQSLQTVHMKHDEIKRKNLLIANDNLIADCLSKDMFYIATNSELTIFRFTEMHDAYTVVHARCLELKVELSKLCDKVQKDDHTELVKRFSNLEVNHLNLELKYQNLKEHFGNNTSPPARDAPDFDSIFTRSEADRTLDFRALDFQITQLTEKVTTKELYDSIKITRAKHIEHTTALLTENKNLKVQIQNKMKCVTKDHVKPKVLAPGRYAIDVEPIPPRNRNNREVHLDYLKHLKESVEICREIIEEAKVERPLDRSLASACFYTKHSQEILEYVIGTCLKEFNQRDIKHAAIPLTRKKQVTFEDQCEMSNSNTHKHVEKLNIQKYNVPVPPFIGVNSCTDASKSQPRSNTKKNRILSAKSVNKQKVKEYPRTNKSSLKTTNHVDSSIISKRTVVQIILWYLDSGCSKQKKLGPVLAFSTKKSVPRTPQQNDIVERRNRTLVEAARTMLIFSKALIFLWVEVVATACCAQNQYLIHTRHNKTPYELVHDKKPDLTFF
ncbi:retrovirus-related pol polyprotein from transposon TNT 1-94 [Tanacetum coccineum]